MAHSKILGHQWSHEQSSGCWSHAIRLCVLTWFAPGVLQSICPCEEGHSVEMELTSWGISRYGCVDDCPCSGDHQSCGRCRPPLVDSLSLSALRRWPPSGVAGRTAACVPGQGACWHNHEGEPIVPTRVRSPANEAVHTFLIGYMAPQCCRVGHSMCRVAWLVELTRPRPNRNISDDSTGAHHDPIRSYPTKQRAGR